MTGKLHTGSFLIDYMLQILVIVFQTTELNTEEHHETSVTSMNVISSGKAFVNEHKNMLTEHATRRGCYT